MSNDLYTSTYNPDVLSCIANLSNDEVFTPPEVANAMLDLLPQELFRDPNTTFLDPACKSGVFLREIAKRLLSRAGGSNPRFAATVERCVPQAAFWHCHHRTDQLVGAAERVLLEIPQQQILGFPF